MGDGMMVVVVVVVCFDAAEETVPKAVALGVLTETARSTLNAGLPMHLGMYASKY